MRGYVWAIVLPGSALLTACAEEPSQFATANVLELRLGEGHESLSAALQRPPPGAKRIRGRAARPDARPHENPTPERAPKTVTPDPEPVHRKAEPPKTPPPRPDPPRARPAFRTVTLAEGQTLYGLCRTHLGSGARWKEVATLNGWSEAKAGRLPAGQAVKLPL
jgi:hypothetical protein